LYFNCAIILTIEILTHLLRVNSCAIEKHYARSRPRQPLECETRQKRASAPPPRLTKQTALSIKSICFVCCVIYYNADSGRLQDGILRKNRYFIAALPFVIS